RLRLVARFAVREAKLTERDEGGLVHVRERPRRARLREPAPAVALAERRGAVIAQSGREVELVEQIDRRLAEVRLVMDLRLVIAWRVVGDDVENVERLRRLETTAHDRERAHIARVQILADGQRAAH